MCLTIPSKVVDIKGNTAVVALRDGTGAEAVVDLSIVPDVKPGDWLLSIEGLAVKRVSAEDAEEILSLLDDRPPIDLESLSDEFKDIIISSKERALTEEDITYLLKCVGEEKEALLSEADTVRRTHLKDFICIHGIIEFSNHCRLDCAYCGLNSGSSTIKRFRMEPEEIVECAVTAVKERGYKLLVLQSGEDPFYTDQILTNIIKSIKAEARVFIFISVGSRTEASYKALKKAGASGVLYRFETTTKKLFKKIHPTGKTFDERFAHLDMLKRLGYYISTGSLIGLPGQSETDIARDLLKVKECANMASIGPFIPSPGTVFKDEDPAKGELYLKAVAILRLMMPSTRIPVVTAYETLHGLPGRRRALRAGANSLMINLTPEKYRPLYELYPEKFVDESSKWEELGLFRYTGSYKMLEERMRQELDK